MTASNHVVTGAVLAAAVPHPAILPVCFLLHFVMDTIPHYGERSAPVKAMGRLRYILPVDAAIGGTILLLLVFVRPEHWFLMVLGGIACASPDLFSFARFLRYLHTGKVIYGGWFSRFHHIIQWGERLWGWTIELAWFLTFGYLLSTKF